MIIWVAGRSLVAYNELGVLSVYFIFFSITVIWFVRFFFFAAL